MAAGMIRKAALLVAAIPLFCGAVQADDYDWEDIFAPYRQRIDAATTSSGNALDVNTVTHMITPWPPYVRNRHIPGNGARRAGAVKRYQEPQSEAQAQPSGGAAALLESLLKPAQSASGGQNSNSTNNSSVSAPSSQ